jgi:seryl-tRNA synthetase
VLAREAAELQAMSVRIAAAEEEVQQEHERLQALQAQLSERIGTLNQAETSATEVRLPLTAFI